MSNRTAPLLLISLVVGAMGASHAVQTQGQERLRKNNLAPSPEQVREAVDVHRAQEREQILRDEALVGRRLTPAERVELREQLRREWELRAMQPGAAEPGLSSTRWTWRSIFPWSRSKP